ncbi:ABC transporter ATP-binding protein [Variovorax rhizosphaerae]|uniref:ABC transporter ATP-binding protein n=1 Tax=Variovorax rhizosphaerae TaxID=1836200 RepID=A0ABU8WDY8_9BURK
MAGLRVEGIEKAFGRGERAVRAVCDLSFEVADREFVFLLGPSGAGKTTTLRTIAGLEQPDAGRVLINGADMTWAAPRERNVAMVYDKNSLYPHLSVFENMAYPLRLQRLAESELRERVMGVAKILQIERMLERRPRELSGGQQQRVAIGRMLVRRADLFLMDEPISHLDAKLRAHMRLEFKKLQREFQSTILYVSHDQLEAMTMGDRIVAMNEGVVQQIGPPRVIFDRPANRFVAGFVGEPSMNIADCTLEDAGGAATLRFGHQRLALDRDWLDAAGLGNAPARALSLGIRPQHLSLAPHAGQGAPNVICGVVYAAETLGSETILDVEADGVIFRAWIRNSALGGAPEIGEPIGLQVDPRAIYLFDRAIGRTLAYADLSRLDDAHALSSGSPLIH